MEEALRDALLEVAARFADGMREGLVARGLPGDLYVRTMGDRVIVASRSAAVRDAEIGRPGTPPVGALRDGLLGATRGDPDYTVGDLRINVS